MSQYRVVTDNGAYLVTTDDPSPTMQQAIGPGSDANARNFAMASTDPRAVPAATADPVMSAKLLPAVTGGMGAASPIPMGATLGTVAGRQVSNELLRLMGKPEEIPSTQSQVGEGLLSAAGDLTAIPAIKANIAGKQIGAAESAAGLGNVTKEAPPSSMRTAVKYVQGLKDKLAQGSISIADARSIKPAIDTIFNKGWLNGTEYMSDLAKAKSGVMNVLNKVPGREEAAGEMASALQAPNLVNKVWGAIPKSVKWGLGLGSGLGAGEALGGATTDILKKAFTGR